MKIYLVLAVGAILALTGADENAERCDKLFSFVSDAKTRSHPFYSKIGLGEVDLKQLSCKVTAAKTLREVYASFHPPQTTYEDMVAQYVSFQEVLEAFGGYSSAPRYIQLLKDMKKWMQSLTPGSKLPSEACDLPKLKRFFEVMQVKYGSRWLSYIALSKNEMILVTDPAETAKTLHATKSAADVIKALGVKPSEADAIYHVVLTRNVPIQILHSPDGYWEKLGEAVTLFGDLGLFNLSY